jgi:NTE family protein
MLSGEQVVHRRGFVRDGAAASMTLPGILPPYRLDGRILLDGGLLNNLPVDVMAATGEGPMIAVDVSAQFEAPADGASRFRRKRLARVAAWAREAIVGYEWRLPSFNETITRSIVLGSVDTAEAANRYADVVIFPDVAGYPMLSWEHIDLFREAGRRAAREAFDRAPAGVLG